VPQDTTETVRLLVVSRESALLRPLFSLAEANAWQVESVMSAWDAMERMQSGVAPHVFLLDLPRGDGDSLHILRWVRRLRPDLPVIVACYAEDAMHKKEAIRLGAQEVLIRPLDDARLESAIYRHLSHPENEAHEAALQAMRHAVRDKKHVATCLGFGPRFLHSTGQAYKGGPNSGVFLQLTCDDAKDLPVPEQKYTFGVVKAAQARGDFQVLAERGRRALRVHLGSDLAAGLRTLQDAVKQALA